MRRALAICLGRVCLNLSGFIVSAGTNQQFVTALLDCQRSLYAYLYKLTLDPAAAQEVLQEANLVLLAKQDEFEQIEHFGGWAARIAYFQLLAYRKRQSRERQRLSPELVEMLADEGQARVQPQDGRLAALGECLKKLTPADRELIDQRYGEDLPSRKIAEQVRRSARAVSQSLYRIRTALSDCIRRQLAEEGV